MRILKINISLSKHRYYKLYYRKNKFINMGEKLVKSFEIRIGWITIWIDKLED